MKITGKQCESNVKAKELILITLVWQCMTFHKL